MSLSRWLSHMLTFRAASLWALGNPTLGVLGRVETGWRPTAAGIA